MTITGKQLLDWSRTKGDIKLKLVRSVLLSNNNAVLIREELFVSNAAFHLINDDPTMRDNVIGGLNIEVGGAVSMTSTDLVIAGLHQLSLLSGR